MRDLRRVGGVARAHALQRALSAHLRVSGAEGGQQALAGAGADAVVEGQRVDDEGVEPLDVRVAVVLDGGEAAGDAAQGGGRRDAERLALTEEEEDASDVVPSVTEGRRPPRVPDTHTHTPHGVST